MTTFLQHFGKPHQQQTFLKKALLQGPRISHGSRLLEHHCPALQAQKDVKLTKKHTCNETGLPPSAFQTLRKLSIAIGDTKHSLDLISSTSGLGFKFRELCKNSDAFAPPPGAKTAELATDTPPSTQETTVPCSPNEATQPFLSFEKRGRRRENIKHKTNLDRLQQRLNGWGGKQQY
jgi:hypothetical protein